MPKRNNTKTRKYRVYVKTVFYHTVEVDAHNKAEAMDIVQSSTDTYYGPLDTDDFETIICSARRIKK